MRGAGGLDQVCGCFPVGRHYPGIAERIARTALPVEGLWSELDAAAPWAASAFVVIDFETTGLDPQNDRVLEVGVACFENGQLSALKNWLVNPTIPIPEEARAIHKISDADLVGAPTFAEIVPELVTYLVGHLPVAYNADFDQRFLRAEMKRRLESEITLARQLFSIAREDSSIGFEPATQYFYLPLDLVEKVINCRWLLARLDTNEPRKQA
jgi:hypothetical protein